MQNLKTKKAFSLIEISIVLLIIGLLIAGISKASDMILDAKLKSARSFTKGSIVNRVPNLVMWVDSTSSESWPDNRRGDGSYYSDTKLLDMNPQVTSNLRWQFDYGYTYKENGYNFLPSITVTPALGFMGANEGFSYAPSKKLFQIFRPNEFTVFVVVKPKAADTRVFQFCNHWLYCFRGGATNGNAFAVGYNTSSHAYLSYATGPNPASDFQTINTSKVSDNGKIEILTAIANSTNANLFTNGERKALASATPYAPTNIIGDFAVYRDVEYFEIIVIGEWIDDSMRKKIQDYLAKKWGVKSMKTDNFS